MDTLKKQAITLVFMISFLGVLNGCEQIIPKSMYGYIPENVLPNIQFIPTDTLQDGTVRYYSDESILVVNTYGDTLKAKYRRELASDLIVYRGIHPDTNKKLYVEYHIQHDEPWIVSVGHSSSVMADKLKK